MLEKLVADLFPDGLEVDAMLAASVEEQEQRMKDREEIRELRRKSGMSEEEIATLEKEEDKEYEEELKKRSTRNVLLDLEVCYRPVIDLSAAINICFWKGQI